MLNIFITTPSVDQNQAIATFIENYLMIERLDLAIKMHSTNSEEILTALSSDLTAGLYFIYVPLNQLKPRLCLLTQIRRHDPLGKLVLLVETQSNDIQNLVFSHHLEVLSIINLNTPTSLLLEIKNCLQLAHARHTHPTINPSSSLILKSANTYRSINYSDIIYLETAYQPHQLIIHLNNERLTCYDTLKKIEQHTEQFIRVHNSFIINMEHFICFNTETKLVTLTGGKQCLVSLKGRKKLFSYIKKHQQKDKEY